MTACTKHKLEIMELNCLKTALSVKELVKVIRDDTYQFGTHDNIRKGKKGELLGNMGQQKLPP